MSARQKSRIEKKQIQKNQVQKKPGKLVKRYVHTKGFSRLAGKTPGKKNPNYVRNRVLLVIAIVIFIMPGIYFCFY